MCWGGGGDDTCTEMWIMFVTLPLTCDVSFWHHLLAAAINKRGEKGICSSSEDEP